MGLGRLLYTARVMHGGSAYMAQLWGGVGKGLFCSPGLSWAICFAAARLLNQTAEEPGLSWQMHTRCKTVALRDRRPLPGPPLHGLKLELGLFCTWLQRATSGPAKQAPSQLHRKSRGVSTPLCYKGQTHTLIR